MVLDRKVTAFQAYRQVAAGSVSTVLPVLKGILDRDPRAAWLIFDDISGTQLDFDFRGTPEDVTAALAAHPFFAEPKTPSPPAKGSVGRPKLGVTSREITLLPRHWTWLETQPNGISAALRRLVEGAMKQAPEGDSQRAARDAAAKVMWSLAGNLPDFEEASRALFRNDLVQFEQRILPWPEDVRGYLMRLARG